MQADGNLVIRNLAGSPIWASGTTGPDECLMSAQITGTSIVKLTIPGFWSWPIFSVTPCYSGSTGPTVGVVGDSITLFSAPAIVSAIGNHYRYLVSGMFGYTIGEQLPAIINDNADPLGPPQDMIVNLGTNDAGQNVTNWQMAYNQMIADLAPNACVVLVTPSVNADTWGTVHNTIAAQIGAAEYATAASNSKFHVLDWNAIVHTGNNQSLWLDSDGIHPNPAGQAEIASLYAQALQSDCGN